jgi:hypothetical protein
MKKYFFTFFATFFLPTLVWAGTCDGVTSVTLNTSVNVANTSGPTFSTVVCYIIYLINLLIPILFALAFIIFFWGLSKYVIGVGDDKQVKLGRTYMMWGILALFILTSYMAIVNIATNSFGLPTPSTGGSMLPVSQ